MWYRIVVLKTVGQKRYKIDEDVLNDIKIIELDMK